MIELAVLSLMLAASVGAGALMLALFGVLDELEGAERITWCFAVGLGTMGWLVFVLVLTLGTGPMGLAVTCVAATGGILCLRPFGWWRPTDGARLDGTGLILCAAILVILIFDLLEGMSPPADADSLAYHFTLPKRFLDAGQVFFVPLAVAGATPMLLHMTYLAALGLGGETVLTLWVMVTTWAGGGLLYTTCRHYLSANWSLATTLLFLSTPAVLYGGGSGQLETRLVLFVLVAAPAMARAVSTGRLGYVALAGMAAGFYAGAKFTGLLFLLACALPLLLGKAWFRGGLIYGAVALVAGGQWYLWGWVHTGDPVFPSLFAVLGLPDSEIWNATQHAYFRLKYISAENPLPLGLETALTYPVRAAFGLVPGLEAGRTGFGPALLVILPMAIAGACQYRRRLATSPLTILAAIALAFYTIWILSGTSQRVRHLLPLYPLLLLAMSVAAVRWAAAPALRRPLVAATGLAILVQLGGQALFGLNYARHVFRAESREAFLARNVATYGVVPWINRELGKNQKILVDERQLLYLIDIPTFNFSPYLQAQISLRRAAAEPGKFLRALKRQGITHLLFRYGTSDQTPNQLEKGAVDDVEGGVNVLRQFGCARIILKQGVKYISSRTLDSGAGSRINMGIAEITNRECRL